MNAELHPDMSRESATKELIWTSLSPLMEMTLTPCVKELSVGILKRREKCKIQHGRVLTAEPEVVNSEKSCHGRGGHGRAPKCIFLTINMWVPENDGKRRREGERRCRRLSRAL